MCPIFGSPRARGLVRPPGLLAVKLRPPVTICRFVPGLNAATSSSRAALRVRQDQQRQGATPNVVAWRSGATVPIRS